MKIFKIILIVIIIIAVIFLTAALFIKKDYIVEEETTINKPKQDVFNYIRYLKNQGNYNKWVMMDPNMKQDYIGTDGTVGFVSSWDSENKNVGKGQQEIKKIAEGERIDLNVRFEKPFKNEASVYMTTESLSENQTKVKWVMTGKNPYPVNMMNLFIPGMLGKDLAISLSNLKRIMEK